MKLIKFSATWCGPCKTQASILENFTACPVEEIDVDDNNDMVEKYSIRSIPTLILVGDDGKNLWRAVGVQTLETLNNVVDRAKNNPGELHYKED